MRVQHLIAIIKSEKLIYSPTWLIYYVLYTRDISIEGGLKMLSSFGYVHFHMNKV